ncbi:MAG: sensor histidine kinase [Cyclobacteriaceae bacterium]
MFDRFKHSKWYKTIGNITFLLLYKYVGDVLAYTFYNVDYAWSFSPRHYIESILSVLLILEICSVVGRYIDKKFYWAERAVWRSVFLLGFAVVGSMLVTPIVIFISSLIHSHPGLSPLELPFTMLTNWGLTAVILAYDLITSLIKKWRQSILEVERFKKESIEFRFETLKNQVNPHFLFNSLNTLPSLMHIDIDAAEKFLRQLSKVYRYVLENRDREVISLKTELQILQSYIYLVEMRFKDKLKVNISVPDTAKGLGLPPMTLQMLIENAIKHNELSKQHPLTIDITSNGDGYLVVENAKQLKTSKEFSTKVGLSNIINRYKYLSDRKIEVEEGEHVFVVKVPLLSQERSFNGKA